MERKEKILKLKKQKEIELNIIKTGQRTYSKGNKRETSEYRVCLTCKRILYFTQFRSHNEKYKSHGWPDPNNKRRLSRCKFCESIEQKSKRDARPAKRLFLLARRRAKRDKVPFNITIKYLESIWPKDNKCPILGKLFKSGIKNKWDLPTVDKVIRKKGYVKGNVAIISYRANYIKGSVDDFSIFDKMYKFLKKFR